MTTEWELVDGGTFTPKIEDTDLEYGLNIRYVGANPIDFYLWVRNTTVVARFGIRLVLTITIAASRTTTHIDVWKQVRQSHPNNRKPSIHV